MAKKNKEPLEFSGRIVNSDLDFQSPRSDVEDPPQFWYPESQADVSSAVKLLQDRKTPIRSGIQMPNNDIVDGSGRVVINLGDLQKVTIKKTAVTVEAGTTAKILGDQLIAHKLALPISDNDYKSIVSNLLFEEPSYLIRTLGSLSDYVSSINAIKPNGEPIEFYPKDSSSCTAQCVATNSVVTQVKFKAVSASPLWMFRKTFSYLSEAQFSVLAIALFKKNVPFPNVDLVLEAYNGLFNIPLIRITALGAAEEGKEAVITHINEVLEELLKSLEFEVFEDADELETTGAEVLEEILSSEVGPALDPMIDTERFHSTFAITDDFEQLLITHTAKIHEKIAFGAENIGKIKKEEYITRRIQMDRENQLEIIYYVYNITDQERKTTPQLELSKSVSDSLFETGFIPEGFVKERIPDFKGAIFISSDFRYKKKTQQYATTSYPKDLMRPFMVAYPLNDKDIKAAIKFAIANDKKIVARSGGHQYSGKSSGAQDTIVLSMDAFNRLTPSSDNSEFEVGPAIKLTELASKFKSLGVTVPHGECPLVAIGGHAQTGGYGHLLRCFGILIDYIVSFDIILADCSKITVTRPSPESSINSFNDKLYWAVLGGNAGSFGIITKYRIATIKGEDYPNSYGFSVTRRFCKDIFLNLMKEVQTWTKGVANNSLPKDMDFMMTATSSASVRLPFPPLLVELVHSNMPQNGSMPVEFKSVIGEASKSIKVWERALMKSQYETLPDLADSFVRRWPSTTKDGREFKNPYKKRVNCTTKALTDDFINGFADLIGKAISEKGVQLVFQMSIGGGEYSTAKNAKRSAIPHRDYTYCFVFDLFYAKDYKASAERLQSEMQTLMDKHYNEGNELRVFWGSFDDTDMNKTAVRQMYYPDLAVYEKLQEIKKEVDSKDVFQTSLTVKLPKVDS